MFDYLTKTYLENLLEIAHLDKFLRSFTGQHELSWLERNYVSSQHSFNEQN